MAPGPEEKWKGAPPPLAQRHYVTSAAAPEAAAGAVLRYRVSFSLRLPQAWRYRVSSSAAPSPGTAVPGVFLTAPTPGTAVPGVHLPRPPGARRYRVSTFPVALGHGGRRVTAPVTDKAHGTAAHRYYSSI